MVADFGWHEEYSIGVEEIDAQHRRFLKLLQGIYELQDKSIENEESAKLLDELVRYTRFHFQSEELLMNAYLYPGYLEQKNQHDTIIKELDLKVKEIRTHKGDIIKLLFFLTKWFVEHDDHYDKEFGAHVNRMRTLS